MNDESKKLRETIERATAAADDVPQDLDANTASLRSTWLQFGNLIEQESRFGGGHVGNHRHQRATHVPHAGRRQQPARPFWLVTIAASLLVAAGVAFALRLSGGSHRPQKDLPQVAGSDVRPNRPTEPVAVPKQAPPQAVQPQTRIGKSGDPLEWGDSVDDEISAVGEAAIYARQDVFAQSSGVLEIETGLNELKQEVEQGNL